jgi:hypothetical protein
MRIVAQLRLGAVKHDAAGLQDGGFARDLQMGLRFKSALRRESRLRSR